MQTTVQFFYLHIYIMFLCNGRTLEVEIETHHTDSVGVGVVCVAR